MAQKPKKGRAAARRKKSKPKPTSVTRRFTFLVPVYFQMQFTFDETDVKNLDDDGSSPEISEAGAEALGEELRDYLGQQYIIESIEALNDDADFLGAIEE